MSEIEEAPAECPDIVRAHLAELHALCRRFGVRPLDLFGLAATGRFDRARSDLDFLVDFAPMPPARYAKACRGMREGLAEMFGHPIDLLTESALSNPYLRRQIEAEKRLLYPAP